MSARNSLLMAPPYEVVQALTTLGANLRTARLRRKLSISAVAERIGVGRHVVAHAERGNASTGIGIYAGLMWAYGLSGRLAEIVDPDADHEGRMLAMRDERVRGSARARALPIDNNF